MRLRTILSRLGELLKLVAHRFMEDKGLQIASALTALGAAVVITTGVIIVLYKFGWDPAFLKSRDELAQVRADRIAARQRARAVKAGKPEPAPERYRPAPTKRTSTGATNRQRRTRDTRKR